MSQRMSLVLHGSSPQAVASRSLSERIGESIRSYVVGPMSLKDPELAKFFQSGNRTAAGPVVTELTAFTCAAFWDGVNQISSDVAKLPLSLMKRRQSGGSDPYLESQVYKLMKFAPNPETTSIVFRRTLTAHALVYGNGYAEIVRDKGGRVKSLWNLHPSRVQPFYDGQKPSEDGRQKPLRYRVDGKTIFDARDILHVPGLSDDGTVGMNMVSVAREAIGLALASQQFAAAFFGNGTRFGGVLSSDQDLDDVQAAQILERIETLHAKADKAFRLLVLGQGFTFTESGVKPSDAQMTEIRQQQVVEVARYLNMPPHKLKELSRSTNNNIEHQDLEYYKGPILTWITVEEQEFEAKLISPLERGIQFFKHNANAFLRGDIKSRYEALGIARDKGIINADEWREWEDWNPQPNGQGQLYLVQSAQVPVEKLAALVDAQIDATKQKAMPPASKTEQDVRDADTRAELAEQVAREERERAETLRAELAAAIASGTANVEEIASLRESVAKQQGVASELTALSERMRSDVERIAADHHEAEAGRLKALEAQRSAEDMIDTVRRVAYTDSEARARAESDLLAAQAREVAAVAAVAEAQKRVEAAEAMAAQSGAETEAEAVARRAAEDAAAQARISADEAIAETRRLADALAQATAQVEVVRTDTERTLTEAGAATQAALQAQLDAMQARLDAHQTSHDEEVIQLKAALAKAEQEREAESTRAAAALTARAAQRADEVDRLTGTIAAHRALIVDAMGRMTRREVEKARSHKATPEKLRNWLKTVDALHAEICVEALLPAVRTHLAWKRSDEDPLAVTMTIVQGHLEALTTRLLTVADTDATEYHALLAKTLERWESEQPERIADQVMREQIAYLRAYEQQGNV
jgi:HK97 family phage portal protein